MNFEHFKYWSMSAYKVRIYRLLLLLTLDFSFTEKLRRREKDPSPFYLPSIHDFHSHIISRGVPVLNNQETYINISKSPSARNK